MRSSEYSGKNLNKLNKVKRRKINWIKVLTDLNNDTMYKHCMDLFSKLRKGKSMSLNRCAYYTLRHFYSTNSIEDTVRKLGL